MNTIATRFTCEHDTPKTDPEPAIEMHGISKRFGSTLAIDDLSLTISRGSTFGLIGPNGSGKSTIIKMLMGVLAPSAGSVRVLGRDVDQEAEAIRQRVGYVPEAHYMDRWMRVDEVTGFCRSVFASWNDETCREMLERFELAPNKKVKQLSKGMLVKLSLVLAVSHEPEMLVLDEPMSGLDPVAREEFLDGVLRTVCDRGQTVLLSTHSLDDLQRVADTVGFLYSGKLLVHRNIEQLLAGTKRIRATLSGDHPPAKLPKSVIYQQVDGRNWSLTIADFTPDVVSEISTLDGVDNLEVIDVGLEDLFKDFVKGQRDFVKNQRSGS
jgi:ABC-2 type transport system ATP-binding protein